MNIRLKKLCLRNFCGFKKIDLDFSDGSNIKPFSVFYGPNGIGKSTILNAAMMLANPKKHMARDLSLMLRRMTFSKNYDANYELKEKELLPLFMEGTFLLDEDGWVSEKRVIVNNEGMVLNELPDILHGHAYHIDSSNPNLMRNFQISEHYADRFVDIASAVFGGKVELNEVRDVDEFDHFEKRVIKLYTDFILHKKKEGTLNHYKNLSFGEKKIGTMIKMLCDPNFIDHMSIIVIDEVESHINYKLHSALVSKLLEHFPDKQILATTHSGTLIDYVENEYGKQYLYDLEELKY